MGGEAWDRGGLGRDGKTTADFGKFGVEPIHNRWSFLIGATALLEGLQAEEEDTLIGAGTVEAVAADHRSRHDVGFPLEHLGHLQAGLLALAEGSAVLKLEDPNAIALVFLWNEGRGQG